MLSEECGQGGFQCLPADAVEGETPVDFLFPVIGRGRGTEDQAGHIFLFVCLQAVCDLGRLADADEQHTGRQRIQRPCMPDLQVLVGEMLAGRPLDLPYYVGGGPAPGLVDGDDDAGRVVLDAARQAHSPLQDQGIHQTGILSMRRWWRPPAKSVVSQARTMVTAIR